MHQDGDQQNQDEPRGQGEIHHTAHLKTRSLAWFQLDPIAEKEPPQEISIQ